MATSRARAFWMARERLHSPAEKHSSLINGIENGCADGTYYAALRKVNGYKEDTIVSAAEADVWAGLYCTLRDKRRRRSRTPGATSGAPSPPPPPPRPRSLTPSSLSSGRTTPTLSLSPSPGPLYRMTSRTMSEEVLSTCSDSSRATCLSHTSNSYRTSCALETRLVPTHYSSTVLLQVGSTKKRYVEEIKFQTRLVPRRFSERITAETSFPHRHFTSIIEIQCLAPTLTVINLNQPEVN